MKKIVITMFFIALTLSASLYAKDTVSVVSDLTTNTEGNLNNAISAVINADPTGAQLSNTVFKLEHYGYYVLVATITTPWGAHLTIVGPEPGNTQETSLPQIVWTASTSVTTTINFDCYGDLTMKNVWIMSARTSGAQVGSSIVIQDDTAATLSGKGQRLDMDGCIYEYMSIGQGGGAIIPACRNFRGKITNTYFRNMTDPHYRYYGRPVSWTYQSTTWHTDSLIFENCSIVNCGYAYMQEAPCYADYVSFNHCTIVNTMMYSFESSYYWWLSVTNSIFVNVFMFGDTYAAQGANRIPNGGTINIDSVATFSFSVPFSDSKSVDKNLQRHILFANNSYGHENWYIDYLNNNPYMPEADTNKIRRMPMMSGKTMRFFTGMTGDQKNFPYMNMMNLSPAVDTICDLPATYNAATDPQFFLNPINIDSTKAFLYGRWYSGADVNWAFNPNEGLQQVWPVSENLSYLNNTMKTAAMGDLPLGDLYHWWPAEYATWKAQADAERANITHLLTDGPNSVKEIPGSSLPMEFTLKQNYPNPFNPSTKIEYSVPKDGFVSLKVYNNLGQEVATLFSGQQQAGNYVADFNGSNLSSGIYLYRLQSENVSLTKKLVLMK